ncbi:hypothetical protein HanRHA438_Chr14g0675541 [Helianthus annuus]|nr:hypothetical protein HanHA300_Chr14g0541441 [Helianthus annuus]KAJ0470633.1 hypothetical protein HanIR_Chr14g0720861 [Helianthus annuus]KAJ0487331.1 hypothetical protein HanHA89_Chr14g0589221 [Helianthus annuus]KAJ0855641.1 hypothetical protein HanRHA438_Chr14g0675541 [Helianthus annuus]
MIYFYKCDIQTNDFYVIQKKFQTVTSQNNNGNNNKRIKIQENTFFPWKM